MTDRIAAAKAEIEGRRQAIYALGLEAPRETSYLDVLDGILNRHYQAYCDRHLCAEPCPDVTAVLDCLVGNDG